MVIQAFLLAYHMIPKFWGFWMLLLEKALGFNARLMTNGGNFMDPSMFEVNATIILFFLFLFPLS
jgi:hypothetical protein